MKNANTDCTLLSTLVTTISSEDQDMALSTTTANEELHAGAGDVLGSELRVGAECVHKHTLVGFTYMYTS